MNKHSHKYDQIGQDLSQHVYMGTDLLLLQEHYVSYSCIQLHLLNPSKVHHI